MARQVERFSEERPVLWGTGEDLPGLPVAWRESGRGRAFVLQRLRGPQIKVTSGYPCEGVAWLCVSSIRSLARPG